MLRGSALRWIFTGHGRAVPSAGMDFCARGIEPDPSLYPLLACLDRRMALVSNSDAAARIDLHAALVSVEHFSLRFVGASDHHSTKRLIRAAAGQAASTRCAAG